MNDGIDFEVKKKELKVIIGILKRDKIFEFFEEWGFFVLFYYLVVVDSRLYYFYVFLLCI